MMPVRRPISAVVPAQRQPIASHELDWHQQVLWYRIDLFSLAAADAEKFTLADCRITDGGR